MKGPNGERELTGSTTAPDAPSDADFITKEGYGLGVFWANFHGALDPAEGLDAQLPDRYKSGPIGFITFKLNKPMWARMAQYVREYRERGYGKIYAGKDKPREGLGAGCSGFGDWRPYYGQAGLHVEGRNSSLGQARGAKSSPFSLPQVCQKMGNMGLN